MYFAHQGWDLNILEEEEIVLPINGFINPKIEKQGICQAEYREPEEGDENFDISKYIEMLDITHLTRKDFVVDDDACEHCFWHPCVATLRPNWLGQGCAEMDGNNIIRKDKYVPMNFTL